MDKDPDAYRTISEVAEALDIPAHVLRFWETKFPQIRPLKRGGGRRFYRRTDVDLIRVIRRLLYEDAYTIRGVQRLLKSRGVADVASLQPGEVPDTPAEPGPEVTVPGIGHRPADPLLAQLAADITACQAIIAEALRPAAAPEAPEA